MVSGHVLAAALISGCARYKARPLTCLSPLASMQEDDTKKESIEFSYTIFSRRDCRRYLDKDLIGKGYQPILITLTNKTSHTLSLSLDDFSFPCADVAVVAEAVHYSPLKRLISYGVGALFIWPLIIPALVDGMGAIEANKDLDYDFYAKALPAVSIIRPGCSIRGLIFVPVHQFTKDFYFLLSDEEAELVWKVQSTMHGIVLA
jgi:hypothetical protein